LNRRSIEKKLMREQQVENMQMNRPKISEQDITNIEPSISSSSWEEQMSSSSPYMSPVESMPTSLKFTKKSSKKTSSLSPVPTLPSPYISPSLERIPTPYIEQTNFTPPPAYTADEDALEPTASPVTVFGAEKEDLSYRK